MLVEYSKSRKKKRVIFECQNDFAQIVRLSLPSYPSPPTPPPPQLALVLFVVHRNYCSFRCHNWPGWELLWIHRLVKFSEWASLASFMQIKFAFTVQKDSTKSTQTLINKSLVTLTTKESGFDSLLANQKREHLQHFKCWRPRLSVHCTVNTFVVVVDSVIVFPSRKL